MLEPLRANQLSFIHDVSGVMADCCLVTV